jgi:hypothetical protein
MRSLIIWVVGVLCLILLPAPTKASMTVSCNGKTVGEVAAVDDNSILQIKHLQFIVERGRVDSVSIIRSEPYLWEKKVNPQEDTPVTTFSGDDNHLSDYYGNELTGYLARERELNAPRVIESRTVISSKEVLTIVVNLAEIDSTTDLVTGFESVILEFHGSEDLLVTRFTSSKQLLELAQVETEAGANRSIAATTLSSGTPEYLIVTGQALVDAFAPLAKWKTMKGLTAETVTMDEVLAMSTGIDDAEKLRNFLIDKYNSGTRYVLLGGDETVVPIRYAFAANTASMPTLDLLQICDLYFGDVNGVWDVDGDGVYGEPTQDSADFNAELLVGRLPLCTPEQVTAYVSKLIKYEQNPNNGDYAYLNRSLFIAADQMRDYSGVGEHVLLAQSLPVYVASDTIDLIEAPTGVADDPPYPLAGSSITKLSEGWGIMSLLIHGRLDGWVIRSNRYNQWPKSFILTATGVDDTHGFLPNTQSNGMPGLVYSIGCNNGAFDMDTPPFPSANPSVATSFLAKPDGGAVAFVGYSRWGWVATSWQIEQAFLDYLYNVNNNPAEALRYAKLQSTYYRDECYGLNFNGDPEMKIWTNAPRTLSLSVPEALPDGASGFEVTVKADSLPLAGTLITVMKGDSIVAQLQTGGDGIAMIPIEYNFADTFTVFAHKDGFATVTKQLNPQLVLGIDDDVAIPKQFALYQNYPNPFNPTTAITFQVDRPATVTLEIYNVLGEKVSTAMQSQVTAGRHQVEWDGSSDAGQPVSSGIYFAKLQLDDRSKIIKMCLMK